ncbi:MAG: class I tRNA ligase family protein, partial [Chloroflexota bacterium]
MFREVTARPNYVELEQRVLQLWMETRAFEKLRQQTQHGHKWSFLDGPITANNPMGVHHAWGRTYKDIYNRYHAMLGHELRWQQGFDCQGLWVEVEVEKELGFKDKHQIESYGVDRFVEKCKERVYRFAEVQTAQSKRLGYWMDWDNSYYTLSDENNYSIWGFLKHCHEQGWLYRGNDVMPWCPRCGTALSEHEIATEGYVDTTHLAVTISFPLLDREDEALLAWTTTPWTLPANVAAAVNPELTYVRFTRNDTEAQQHSFWMVKGAFSKLHKPSWQVEEECLGADLVGWRYRGPFDTFKAQQGVEHRVLPWDEVSETEGTGVVHIAPGAGKEDFALGHTHQLTVLAPLDESGTYVDGYGWLTGQQVGNVAEKIANDLEQNGLLFAREMYQHRYPVCWRCGTELVFRLVDEWLINMDELRPQMMEAARTAHWIPSFGLERELDWLRNIDDWMISKKRYWGLALPIYPCESCEHVTVVGSKEELQECAVEGWDEFAGHSPHRPWVDAVKIACPACGATVSRV